MMALWSSKKKMGEVEYGQIKVLILSSFETRLPILIFHAPIQDLKAFEFIILEINQPIISSN